MIYIYVCATIYIYIIYIEYFQYSNITMYSVCTYFLQSYIILVFLIIKYNYMILHGYHDYMIV